jgi:hypothetical protein
MSQSSVTFPNAGRAITPQTFEWQFAILGMYAEFSSRFIGFSTGRKVKLQRVGRRMNQANSY